MGINSYIVTTIWQTVSVNLQNSTLEVLMDQVSKQINTSYRIINKQIILNRVKTKMEKPVEPKPKPLKPPAVPLTPTTEPGNLPVRSPNSGSGTIPPESPKEKPVLQSTESGKNSPDSSGEFSRTPENGTQISQNKLEENITSSVVKSEKDTVNPLDEPKQNREPLTGNFRADKEDIPEKTIGSSVVLPTGPSEKIDSLPVTSVVSADTEEPVSIQKDSISIPDQAKTEKKLDISDSKQNLQPAKTVSQREKICKFSIQSNLLYDLVLTPNLGVECRIKEKWGIVVNGLWMHLKWGKGSKTYRIWAVSPEGRYYFSKNNRFYAGAMFHIGQVNLKLGETGTQGDFVGGGITGGYVLPLNQRICFDFGIGLGYTYFKYESYKFIDGENIRQGRGVKNFWGPTKASVTLIINI